MASRKRVTIREVAAAAGVSPAAVSYALRGLQVSGATEERVRRVARELGYEAHPIARALASGRTGTIGILGPSLEDLWQQRLVAEAGRVLLDHERFALVVDAAGDPERQRVLAAQLHDQRVDGLILSPVDPSDPYWEDLAETLAIVSVGDGLPGAAVAGEVLFDNRSGVRQALEHLSEFGHRRITVLRPPGSPTADRPAETVVAAEAERLDLQTTVLSAPYDLEGATAVAHTALTASERPTAVFCLCDSIAYGVYAAARALGLSIPAELSVVGYDNHPISALLTPALTSFDWDPDRLVRLAVAMIVRATEGQGRRRRVVLEPVARQRESVAAPPGGAARARA